MHRGGRSDGVRADFGQADIAHVACFNHLGDGANRRLDWHVGVKARGAIDVDVVAPSRCSE